MPSYSFRSGGLIHGRKTVTTAGTAVLLIDNSTKTDAIIIKALISNVGDIYVGTSGVSSSTGFPISPGEGITITANNAVTNIYINATSNGDGVAYIGGSY